MQTRKLGLAALLLVAYAAASEQPAAAASEQPAASPEAEAASPPPSPSPPSPPPPPPPPPVAVAKSAAQLEAAKTAAAAHAAEAAGAAAKIHAAVTQHGFYTDTVKPFWDDRVAPLVRTYLGSSVCEFLDKLEIYIKDVTEMLKGVDVAELHAHVTAGTLAATSGLIAGGCLVLAPIIFGAEWLTYVLTLLASIVGLVGSTMLLEPAGLFGVRLEILVGGASKCVATLVIQLGAAYTLGSLVNGMRHVAYFAIGAVGAGYGSYLISETVVGLMAQIELVTRYVAVDAITEDEILIACAALAVIGGLLFGRFHDALIDTALGLMGGVLMGQGLITIVLADVLSEERAKALRVQEYYLYYVAGFALLLQLVRACIVSARERAAGNWRPPSPKRGSPRRSPSKIAPSPRTADKAKELSKRTPSKKDMH